MNIEELNSEITKLNNQIKVIEKQCETPSNELNELRGRKDVIAMERESDLKKLNRLESELIETLAYRKPTQPIVVKINRLKTVIAVPVNTVMNHIQKKMGELDQQIRSIRRPIRNIEKEIKTLKKAIVLRELIDSGKSWQFVSDEFTRGLRYTESELDEAKKLAA